MSSWCFLCIRDEEVEKEEAATKIQAMLRGGKARKDTENKKQDGAAAKIQAVFRGNAARTGREKSDVTAPAEYDPTRFYSKLENGVKLTKYGRHGKPAERELKLTNNRKFLEIRQGKGHSISTLSKVDIVERSPVEGQKNVNLTQKELDGAFVLKFASRDLLLIAKNANERQELCIGFNYLILQK
mmetsp:Transcript_6972/g.9362  ORF Transcript_6972/g.9362 Transcript_6972/m.9362 type:complete len:185 (-) Transcript_6972:330-884(-)|eukprot:CAMPEP_0117751192 /NCGR_PEP_ID=MMETSP0947-20121206/10825_1 /TAXON_ID=44440 /ORGANISM="Chattonella subsalsa, Strain CCMP2191" /LENGTH=184 /DNA_ID=CAMNT_0005569519 /DNA_START=286 /DNA_END=840 /DNA_ORIENTATION=+